MDFEAHSHPLFAELPKILPRPEFFLGFNPHGLDFCAVSQPILFNIHLSSEDFESFSSSGKGWIRIRTKSFVKALHEGEITLHLSSGELQVLSEKDGELYQTSLPAPGARPPVLPEDIPKPTPAVVIKSGIPLFRMGGCPLFTPSEKGLHLASPSKTSFFRVGEKLSVRMKREYSPQRFNTRRLKKLPLPEMILLEEERPLHLLTTHGKSRISIFIAPIID